MHRPENKALQDGPFSRDYTTQISVFDWGGRVGGELDFIDSSRRHEGLEILPNPTESGLVFQRDKIRDFH
ncbi:MAG: hypothetical protein ACXV8O_07145 [Methylobacter sp.]